MRTFHLESFLEDTEPRKEQLQIIREMSDLFSHSILIGDTNFTSESEAAALGPRFKDAWQELYQRTPEELENNPGLTFDTVTNGMCREEYNQSKLGEKRQRLDRCFYTHDSIEPVSMKILGDTPYIENTQEFVSDHYGICVKLRFKDNT